MGALRFMCMPWYPRSVIGSVISTFCGCSLQAGWVSVECCRSPYVCQCDWNVLAQLTDAKVHDPMRGEFPSPPKRSKVHDPMRGEFPSPPPKRSYMKIPQTCTHNAPTSVEYLTNDSLLFPSHTESCTNRANQTERYVNPLVLFYFTLL